MSINSILDGHCETSRLVLFVWDETTFWSYLSDEYTILFSSLDYLIHWLLFTTSWISLKLPFLKNTILLYELDLSLTTSYFCWICCCNESQCFIWVFLIEAVVKKLWKVLIGEPANLKLMPGILSPTSEMIVSWSRSTKNSSLERAYTGLTFWRFIRFFWRLI